MAISNLVVRKVKPDLEKLVKAAAIGAGAGKAAGLGAAFMLGNKKMVMDRGRYKEAQNVGSKSSEKGMSTDKDIARDVGQRFKREQEQSVGGRIKGSVGALKATVKATTDLAKAKAMKGAQKAGFGKEAYEAGASKRYAKAGGGDANVARVARVMAGESGPLTEKDVQRAKNMMPSKSDSAKDAKIKFETLQRLIKQSKS
jgi:hypothetical protein